MARRGRPKKGKYDDLSSEWKDAVAGSSEEEIRTRIAEVAMADSALRSAQKLDGDLAGKKLSLKYANEPYRDGFKANRLKIEYAREILSAKGKDDGSVEAETAEAAQ